MPYGYQVTLVTSISVGPTDMSMVLQHKLHEVTSIVALNAIRLPGYSGCQHLWFPASVVPTDMGMVLQHKLPEVTSGYLESGQNPPINTIQLPGYCGYQHLGTWGMVLQHKLREVT